MITDKTKALVATLYREGLTIAEICKRTGIRSSATIYNIVTELGIKGEKGKKRGTFSVVLTLPMELREWVEEQGEGLSELITKFAYSQSGCGNEKSDIADSNVGTKIAYSESQGTSEKSGIAVTKVFEDEMPYSESGGKERISDIKANFPYSESETGKSAVIFSATNPAYSESDATCEEKPPYSGSEPLSQTAFAKMRVVFYHDAHPLREKRIVSYVDEDITKGIVTAFFKNHESELKDADEVGVFFGEQLLWLWVIDKLPYSEISRTLE